jgi:hypothetical protein
MTAPDRDPLPSATLVRKARRSSTVACGHYVTVGHVIVRRAGRWECLECVLAQIARPPGEAARSSQATGDNESAAPDRRP